MGDVRKRRRSPAPERKEQPERPKTSRRESSPPDWAGLAVFALLITLAPLAFGAVDQLVQVGLLALFALGLALRPPLLVGRLASLTNRGATPSRLRLLVPALVGVLILKEFAPAVLFGGTAWRTILARDFGLQFPWSHHPEPGRAVDALLSLGLALLWLLWVRTLAGRRSNRAWLAWSLAGAAATVAAVSFLVHTRDPHAIYGLRFTPGWRGFGPFPNRNHTASFLAMGVIMSCGCGAWAAMRRKPFATFGAVVLAGLCLAGLLGTDSRGGVVGLGAGLAVYGALCFAKFRNPRAMALIAAVALVLGAAALAGGSHLFSRFSSSDGSVSNFLRVSVWRDTLAMWADAPLFGHGIASFTSVFPMYQTVTLDEQSVLHPESSWLQWLVELGLIPLASLVFLAVRFIWPHLRAALRSQKTFFLYAAAFATVAGILVHGLIDVPAHRWATAAFALAALALATPLGRLEHREPSASRIPPDFLARNPRVTALVPFAIAILWSLPFLADWPNWSAQTLLRRLAIAEATPGLATPPLELELGDFTLSPRLHHLLGLARLAEGAPEPEWLPHFRAATRLNPGSWAGPIFLARACGVGHADLAFSFWQTAIERGGVRAQEIFNNALTETRAYPDAPERWAQFVTTHPALAIEYASRLPADEAQSYFDEWWNARALNPAVTLTVQEVAAFYALAPRCSSAEKFELYLRARPARASEDFFACARVLHAWGEEARAWQILSTKLHEPPYPAVRPNVTRPDLERRLRLAPDNSAAAQALAARCLADGDEAGAREVVFTFSQRPHAPPFFTRKGAYLLHDAGLLAQAVEMFLREG